MFTSEKLTGLFFHQFTGQKKFNVIMFKSPGLKLAIGLDLNEIFVRRPAFRPFERDDGFHWLLNGRFVHAQNIQ